jgi:PAS domain S-box-containing protein
VHEVTSRATSLFLAMAERKGLSVDELTRGLPVDVAQLRVRGHRVDWAIWAEMLDRALVLCGGAQGLEDLGFAISETPVRHEFKRVARLFASPARLYRLNSRWGVSADFRNIHSTCVELPDGRLRVTMAIDAGERGSLGAFTMPVGILRSLPMLLDLPPAEVKAHITPHGGVYDIDPPRPATLWSRARQSARSLLALAGAETALEQLGVQQQEIVAQNRALQARLAELRHVEEALRASEARWRSLAEHVPATIYVVRPGGAIELVNRPGDRGHGHNLLDLVAPAHRAALEATLARAFATGSAPDLELESARRPGVEPRTYLVHVAPLGDAQPPDGLIVLLTDVTDRKRAEHELRKSTEQLRQAQKLEAIGRLAGGVAHDFNNLLTVITTSVSFLIEAADDRPPPEMEDLAEIKSAAERGAQLTRQLLAVSRQEVREPVPLDLNRVIGEVEGMLHRLLGEDVQLRVRVTPNVGHAMLDGGQMHQVILNLAVNARDAMPDGGLLTIETDLADLDQVFAEAHPGVTPGPHVVLSISDTGSGMTTETVTRIFEPFFTTKAPGMGTGLGLSIVRGIVEQSGGCIYVYSEPGLGTTFRLYFPRVEATGLPAPPGPVVTRRSTGSETILLAEDDPSVRRVSRTILSARGYRVLEAAGPEEAIAIAERHSGAIDLLVTDVVMPRMSGRELSAHLTTGRPGLRVLYVSGYAEQIVVSRGVVAPGVSLLQKPFAPEALAQRVRDVLDRAPTD